jgi:hypothetical protein
MDDIVRVRVYAPADGSTRDVHEVRSRFFSEDGTPASTLVRVSSSFPTAASSRSTPTP